MDENKFWDFKSQIVKAACILGASIIVSAIIYAYSCRYSTNGMLIIDTWKKEIIEPKIR